jgi:DNA-binding NtrC family response regulator
MSTASSLKGKVILVVDDEPDVLDSVEQILDMCIVHKAKDYDSGRQFLLSYIYDIVILDIMGVNGFQLLKTSVSRGFPTVILTAHAVTPDALKESIKLGAVFFLPKENLSDLKEFLEEAIRNGSKVLWAKFFDKLGLYFKMRFGADWKDRDQFLKDFEQSLRKSEGT